MASGSSDSDTWSPVNVRKKAGQRKACVIDSDESEEELAGCTSEDERDDTIDKQISDDESIIGPSSDDEPSNETVPCSPGENSFTEGAGTLSAQKSPIAEKSGGSPGNGTNELKSKESTSVSPQPLELEKRKSQTPPDNGRKMFDTSTPLVTGAAKASHLDVTAIPPMASYFNATIMEEETSPKSSLQTTPPSFGALCRRESTTKQKNQTPASDIEDALVADLNNITIKGKKEFSFKPRGAETGKQKTAGAACLDYFDEEDEDDSDSISANFSLDLGSKDSGNGDSDVQIVSTETRKPKVHETVTLDDTEDEMTSMMAKIKNIALGSKTSKAVAPKKTIFLNEPPPIEKKTYAYDPTNVKHQEFYGDVQRTVTMMAGVLETMPMPDDQNSDIDLPKGLVQLFDHQKYGLRWLGWRERQFPGGGILADEMGLGKTIMIIALIMKSKHDEKREDMENWIDTEEVASCIPSKTTLVVCPVGCILQWNDEIKSKGRGLRVYMYHGPNRTTSAAQLAQYDVVLTTYHTVVAEIPKDGSHGRNKSPLKRVHWKRIVLDEAHNIRNPKTGSALGICQLLARHRWAVTGTPVHNKPEDFYSMMKFLRMKPFDDPKVWDFWIGMKTVRKSADAQQRLHILGKALILRRTKSEVQEVGGNVETIPPKHIKIVEIDLSEGERRVYDYLMQFCKNKFDEFLKNKEIRDRELNAVAMTYTAQRRQKKPGNGDTPDDIKFSHLFAMLIRLRQCALHPHLIHTMLEEEDIDDDTSFDELNDNHIVSMRNPVFDRLYESTKIQKVLDDLEAIREKAKKEDRPMDKVVIVSSWTYPLEILHDHLRRRRFSSVSITGKEKNTERADNMKKFNLYPDRYQICLLSLMAGGVGLNLVGGNYVFILEPHWNPQLELQAQDRVHRFGQKKEVFIRRYISKETVESRILGIQEDKMSLADGVLNSAKRTRGGGLSIHQLRKLFE